MYAHKAFGLTILSERKLPIASASAESSTFDLAIRWGEPLPRSWADTRGGLGDYEFSGACHRFGWPELGEIEIQNGSRVTVRELETVANGLVEHVLLGPIIADSLLSRGMLPLHASAVQVPGGVIAFTGNSGQGKSTLAAALEQQHCVIHADDIVAIDPETLQVPYGLGRVKLNPDSSLAVGHDPSLHPLVYAGINKRSKPVEGATDRESRKLIGVYRIKEGAAFEVTRGDPRRAVFDLYANCFRVEVAQHACGAKELLRRCAFVAKSVNVFELYRPRDLARLPDIAASVLAHAATLSRG